jgi:hypothetical protein
MSGEDQQTPELADNVRRSIFIPEDLEAALARLAEERGTTTNDLICDLLIRAVADSEATSTESAQP